MEDPKLQSGPRSRPTKTEAGALLFAMTFSMAAVGWVFYESINMPPSLGSRSDTVETGVFMTFMVTIYLIAVSRSVAVLLEKPAPPGSRTVTADADLSPRRVLLTPRARRVLRVCSVYSRVAVLLSLSYIGITILTMLLYTEVDDRPAWASVVLNRHAVTTMACLGFLAAVLHSLSKLLEGNAAGWRRT